MTNENSWHQGARNVDTQGRDFPCYYARYPAEAAGRVQTFSKQASGNSPGMSKARTFITAAMKHVKLVMPGLTRHPIPCGFRLLQDYCHCGILLPE
jgi:hypothetical protein